MGDQRFVRRRHQERAARPPEDFESLRATPGRGHGGFRLPPAGLSLDELERDLVTQALERTGGNQTRAAALLGMHRDQIRYRIEKFGLARRDAQP